MDKTHEETHKDDVIESDRATLAGPVWESLSKEVTAALTVGEEKDPAGQSTGRGCVRAKALGQCSRAREEARYL